MIYLHVLKIITYCPQKCNILRSTHSRRKYCDCGEIGHCKESDYCDISANTNTNNHGGRRGGCDECEDGYFKRDWSTPCVSCCDVFHGACAVCGDFYGC